MLDILQVTDPGCCGIRRVDEDGCCATCGRDFFDPETGEEVGDGTRVPNTALSGAALDLLEALETMLAFHDCDCYFCHLARAAIAKAAIAKARGK